MKIAYQSSILQSITICFHVIKVLVGLYEEPERPSNAVEYIKVSSVEHDYD